MTGIKIVDASALAAILFAEPEAEAIAERLTGARLAAPALLDYELANVCLTKMRRQPSQREALRAALRLAHRLKMETVEVDHAAMLDLAEATGLTACDASYLWLARFIPAASGFDSSRAFRWGDTGRPRSTSCWRSKGKHRCCMPAASQYSLISRAARSCRQAGLCRCGAGGSCQTGPLRVVSPEVV